MNRFVLYTTVLFLGKLSNTISSIGTIVGSAVSQDGIKKTLVVVSMQSFAAIVSFLFSKYFVKTLSFRYGFALLVVMFSFSQIIMRAAQFTPLFYVLLTLRYSFGIFFFSKFLSTLKNYWPHDYIKKNKHVQLVVAATSLFAIGLSPILAMKYGFFGIFFADSFFLVIAGIVFFVFKFSSVNLNVAQKNIKHIKLSPEPKMKLIVLGTFLMWAVAGIFHVIEVPILYERFSASSYEISLIFTLSICVNMFAIRMFPARLLHENSRRLFFISILSIYLFSLLYIATAVPTLKMELALSA